MSYIDGTGSFTSATQVGPKRVRFPFLVGESPDKYARIIERDYIVAGASYTPTLTDRTSYTNYLTRSQTLAHTDWTATNLTVTDAAAANPNDGSTTASTLIETSATGEHRIRQNYTLTAVAHTLSARVARNGRDWAYLAIFDGTSTHTCFFNLASVAVGTASAGVSGTIASLSSTWLQISMTVTTAAGAGNVSLNVASDGSTISYTGDTSKGLYAWGMQIERASSAGPYVSTTTASRTISAPPTDFSQNGSTDTEADRFAYLVAESAPEIFPEGNYWRVTRTYARIPANQTLYSGSRYFSLPTPQNTYNAQSQLTAVDFQYNQTLGAGHFQGGTIYTTGDGKLYEGRTPSASVAGRATAGTFTITYDGATTAAITYNSSAGIIKTAVDGLATTIADGITVAVSNNLTTTGALTFTITITGSIPTGWPKLFTMNVGSLTVTTSQNSATSVINGNAQVMYIPDHLTISSHGFDTSRRLAAINTNNIAVGFPSGSWGSIDTNTIWIPATGAYTWAAAGEYAQDYAPATALLRTRSTLSFALPGVSTGITTPADITVPAGLQNPDDFLNAVATLTGWQDYYSDGPKRWLDNSSIHVLDVTAINIDDA